MTTTEHSESQAKAQLESILEMVAAMGVDYDRLEELRDERKEFIATWEVEHADNCPENGRAEWESANPDESAELAELEEAAGDCKDDDDARQRVNDDPLSVQVRSDWHDVGEEDIEPAEFCILLCTGGPACRIVGELESREPTSARIEHQDWGTPWTEYRISSDEEERVLSYCRQFYFGD